MSMIRLTNRQNDYTPLPNAFIESYMAPANGEFVKVYICLLHISFSEGGVFDPEAVADLLSCTEKDVVRALRYWADRGLISLSVSAEGNIDSVTVLPVSAPTGESSIPVKGQDAAEQKPASTGDAETTQEASLSAERVEELKQNKAVEELLYVAEQYIGRPLSSNEMKRILRLYDLNGMSADLIQYLIEYCVSHGHKSIRYMETVALAWQKEGITTVAEAQDTASCYSKDYFPIMKALGITGRNPIPEEISFMRTWYDDYGFSLDLIRAACSRTVMNTGQSSFQYTDRILSDWKKQSVKTLADVQELDSRHQSKKEATAKKPAGARHGNRFNNFPQRRYDFAEYEKQLINK